MRRSTVQWRALGCRAVKINKQINKSGKGVGGKGKVRGLGDWDKEEEVE